jgi:hypothetical protein
MCSPSRSVNMVPSSHQRLFRSIRCEKTLPYPHCSGKVGPDRRCEHPTPSLSSYHTHASYSLVAHHPWACSSPIHQKQSFLWRSGNLTSFAFLSTTHPRAVDGNHQFLCFFALPSPLRCRRDKMLHLLFSVLEGSFLTSERGPVLVF